MVQRQLEFIKKYLQKHEINCIYIRLVILPPVVIKLNKVESGLPSRAEISRRPLPHFQKPASFQ